MLAMPIFPSEIFQIAYSNIILCPDENCKYFKIYIETISLGYNLNSSNDYSSDDIMRNKVCFYCENKSNDNKNDSMAFILLDLRISDDKNNDNFYDIKPGFLPMTVILDQKDLNDENVIYKHKN